MVLRQAKFKDVETIFGWRNDPWIIALSSNQKKVTWSEHIKWFNKTIKNDNTLLYIIEIKNDFSAGTVRINKFSSDKAAISIYLIKKCTGKGLGVTALIDASKKGIKKLNIKSIHAFIREDNSPSISAFTKAGYRQVNPSKDCPVNHIEMVYTED